MSRFFILAPTKQSDDDGPRVSRHSPASIFGLAFILLASTASIVGLIRAQDLAVHSGAIDFYQFWLVGQFIDQPGFEKIYSEAVYDRIGTAGMQFSADSSSARMKAAASINAELYSHKIEPISTPVLYAVLRLFSTGDYEIDANRYQLFCTIAFATGLIVLARSLRFNWAYTLIALAITLTWFGPFKVDILDGNTTRLQLAGLAMAIGAVAFLPQRIGLFTAGFLFALNVLFKPNTILAPLALLALYALARQWRAVVELAIGLMLGTIVAIVGSSLYLKSFELWPAWCRAISVATSSDTKVYSLENQNCSIARMVGGLVHFNATWILVVVAAAIFFTSILRRKHIDRPRSYSREVYAVGTGVLAMLLSSPIVWPSYFIFLLPTMFYLVRPTTISTWSIVRWIATAAAFISVAASTTPWLPLDLSKLIYVIASVTAILLTISAADFFWAKSKQGTALEQPCSEGNLYERGDDNGAKRPDSPKQPS